MRWLHTPLLRAEKIEKAAGCQLYLKPETLQITGAFKIRGALNKALSLPREEIANGIIASSSGNHAQGVAYSASLLKITAVIFMPTVTPLQKINKVKNFGGEFAEIKLVGANYDESYLAAKVYCRDQDAVFVHPFNDYRVMSGQGTVGKEIFEYFGGDLDYVFAPIGGGGLISEYKRCGGGGGLSSDCCSG